MIHFTGNRRTRRFRTTYLDHPAYIWAIESDHPHWWAKLLVYHYMYDFDNRLLEGKMGDRLTFTKFNGVRIYEVTGKAIAVCLTDSDLGKPQRWLARSNIRSDDDRRMVEIGQQLQAHDYIVTSIHVVDWLVKKEGWKP